MRRSLLGLLWDRGGASAVEFAFVVGPMVLLILGVFEFGRVIYTRQALHETAQQTARCLGILQTNCTLNGAVDADAAIDFAQAVGRSWWVAIESDEVAIDDDATCGGVGDFSQVTITHTFQTALPAIVTDIVNVTTLQSTACFPNATPPAS